MDEETLNAMKKPRCGDPDLEEEASRFKRYDAVRSWSKTTFKWYIQYSGEDLSESDQQRAIADAFAKWKGACNVLSFTQTTDPNDTDFDIRLKETCLFLFLFVLFSLALVFVLVRADPGQFDIFMETRVKFPTPRHLG